MGYHKVPSWDLYYFLHILNPISDIIKKYKALKFHLYADDILIYSINKANNFSDDLSQCANEINQWLLTNKLMLNATKT